MGPPIPVHDLGFGDCCPYWEAGRERFRRGYNVGFYCPVLDSKPASRPPHASLDLVVDQHNVVLVEELLQTWKVIVWSNNVSSFSLNRLVVKRSYILRPKNRDKDLFLFVIDK